MLRFGLRGPAASLLQLRQYSTIMPLSVSIIIPNRNGAATIASCLEAAYSSSYKDFEVIVVDDFSDDNSVGVIRHFPCKCVQLAEHSGASAARNAGAENSNSDLLFFTDADCLLNEDTLAIAVDSISSEDAKVVLGGTYSKRPADDTFYSRFQSVFVHFNETRNPGSPDYVATHAMLVNAEEFNKSGGFAEDYLPVLEDVEFSHRMRRNGYRLLLNPAIQVRHIFGFSLAGSMQNAFRKSMFWTAYSIKNKDLLKDSGTASRGLKLNAAAWLINALLATLYVSSGEAHFLFAILLISGMNLAMNRGLLAAFYQTGGAVFLAGATAYYLLIFPLAVGAGSIAGLLRYRGLLRAMRYTA